ELLVRALADVHIDAIYSPRLQRNLDTVAPLAAARGLTVHHLPTDNPVARLMADGAGKTIVWVGNKGNIASIWQALDIAGPAPLAHEDLHFLDAPGFGPMQVTKRNFSL
ncbi:MAG: histidine phosphatase family protein, partial [Marinovum sp.]|nr:histidine phosphatase family protein [Marinovum sp.]